MQVFRGFHHPGIAPACALTIGNFDGVHRGHQAMLALLNSEASHRGLPSCVMTFEPHPRDYFAAASGKPELAPARIATLRDKLGELHRCGIDQVVVLRFDKAFAAQSPQAFVDDVLVRGLGTRYVLGPLGEGQGQDPDPLLRYDAVDCVTFVEEVLALSRSESADKVSDTLQQIRYRGDQITYVERNHFVEAAWLPNNVKKGYLKEITRDVAGADVLESKRTFTLDDWKHRSDAKEISLPDALAPVGEFDLNILPLDKVVAHQDQLPNGAVMIMVRSWGPLTSNRIGHLGLIVRKGDAVFVRHASSLKHEVIDVPIATFVENCKNLSKKWPVVGLSFAAPQG